MVFNSSEGLGVEAAHIYSLALLRPFLILFYICLSDCAQREINHKFRFILYIIEINII